MAKEVYLYSPIYDFTMESVLSSIQEAIEEGNEEIILRVNSPGGQVFAGWGIMTKLSEMKEKIKIKVDGYAASMAAFMLTLSSYTEANDLARFMLHRASGYVETEEDQKLLDSINKDMEKKLKEKLDEEKFKQITGITIKELFTSEKRRDVWLTAKEAKAVGLIDKVVPLKVADVQAFEQKMNSIAAIAEDPKSKTEISSNTNTMNLEKLKAEHPEVYNGIVKDAVASERDRVGAWMANYDTDPERVKKGIKDGEALTQSIQAEFNVKAVAVATGKNIEDDSAGDDKTQTAEAAAKAKTEKEESISSFQAEVKTELGIKA